MNNLKEVIGVISNSPIIKTCKLFSCYIGVIGRPTAITTRLRLMAFLKIH